MGRRKVGVDIAQAIEPWVFYDMIQESSDEEQTGLHAQATLRKRTYSIWHGWAETAEQVPRNLS